MSWRMALKTASAALRRANGMEAVVGPERWAGPALGAGPGFAAGPGFGPVLWVGRGTDPLVAGRSPAAACWLATGCPVSACPGVRLSDRFTVKNMARVTGVCQPGAVCFRWG